MRTSVSKWVNRQAIRIPKAVAEKSRVQVGSAVGLTIQGNSLVIRSHQPMCTIEGLVSQMGPTGLSGRAWVSETCARNGPPRSRSV